MKVIFEFDFTVGDCFYTDVNETCKYVLKMNRYPILKALTDATGIKGLEKDWEGGIDNWFGPGSAFLYEMGCAIRITYGPEEATKFEILDGVALNAAHPKIIAT